eukprot:Gb_02683 [translate_table: standard]
MSKPCCATKKKKEAVNSRMEEPRIGRRITPPVLSEYQDSMWQMTLQQSRVSHNKMNGHADSYPEHERPGEPDYAHYMRTITCKYGDARMTIDKNVECSRRRRRVNMPNGDEAEELLFLKKL